MAELPIPIQALSSSSAPEHISGHQELAKNLLAHVVTQEIVDVYDQLESILNRISVERNAEVTSHLTKAKEHVFTARVIAEGEGQ